MRAKFHGSLASHPTIATTTPVLRHPEKKKKTPPETPLAPSTTILNQRRVASHQNAPSSVTGDSKHKEGRKAPGIPRVNLDRLGDELDGVLNGADLCCYLVLDLDLPQRQAARQK